MKAEVDFYDSELFGNDAGEDEDPEVLDSYFINKVEFNKFLSEKVGLCVARAKKGMGKSALLNRMAYSLSKHDSNIIIKVTGNDLLGLGDFQGKDQAYLENYWKRIILKRIAIEIGANIGIAATDDAMSLVEAAEYEGFKQKNIIGSIISRIKLSLGGAVSLERRELKISEGIGFALDRYLQECDKYSVWLLIDDIDATYIDTPDYQSRIGAFFGALRLIVNELKGVKVRATVRSDVWTNLRKVEHLDKWEQYIVDIKWDDASMRRMLSMRILSYLKRNDLIDVSLDAVNDYKEIVELVFLRNFPWDGGVVDSFVPLKLFSAGRPRWMGQICRMSGECCANRGGARIGIDDIKEILENFGLNRVNDLMKEHSHQFPHVDKLVDIFRGNKKSYSLVELSMLLKEKYTVFVGEDMPKLDGIAVKDEFQLGRFLYKIGFLSGQHANKFKKWIHYNEQPDFFDSMDNKNGQVKWHVHPSYRAYLRINGYD